MIQKSPAVLLRLFRENQTVIAICVTTAIVMMGEGIISPLLPLLTKEFGVSMAMVGKWFTRRLPIAMAFFTVLLSIGFIASPGRKILPFCRS